MQAISAAEHRAPQQAGQEADLPVDDQQQQVPGRARAEVEVGRDGEERGDAGTSESSATIAIRTARGLPAARAGSSQTCAAGASSSARYGLSSQMPTSATPVSDAAGGGQRLRLDVERRPHRPDQQPREDECAASSATKAIGASAPAGKRAGS